MSTTKKPFLIWKVSEDEEYKLFLQGMDLYFKIYDISEKELFDIRYWPGNGKLLLQAKNRI